MIYWTRKKPTKTTLPKDMQASLLSLIFFVKLIRVSEVFLGGLLNKLNSIEVT